MGTVSKSQAQSSSEIQASYTDTSQQPLADVTGGTVHRDIIDSVADLVSTSFSTIETVRLLSSLQNALLVTPNALSAFGLNWDVVQGQSVAATGTVFFQKVIRPTITIDFPSGTIVQTAPSKDGSVTQFVTTAAARLSSSTVFNPVNQTWEVSAPIIALVSGSVGNVGPGSVNQLATLNRNIDAIINKVATSGGSNVEPNDQYATDILTKTAGSTLGTITGYETAILGAFPQVIDVAVAGPGNPAMQRAQYGDEVDIYLLGTSYTTFTNTLTASSLTTDLLQTHPTVSLSSVVGTTSNITFVVGTDVILQKDTSVVFGNSVNAFDYVAWQTTNRPGAGQTFTVVGQYDANVPAVQNYLNLPTVRFVTEDILAKSATRVGLVINTNITANSGVDRTSLAGSVQTAVINGISSYGLGQSVTQSAVVDIMAAVSGVNEVTIPFNQLSETGDAPGTVTDQIVIDSNSFPRTDTVTITVS